MPRRYEMGELMTRCQRRCDMENSGLISTAEWKALISAQYGSLFALVDKSGLRYFEYEASLTTTGAAYLSEPTDHLATVGLDYVVNTTTGERRELRELMAQEQTRWMGRTGSYADAYAMIDDRIYLYPTPPTGQSYVLRYIPQPPDLSVYSDTDQVDVVTPDGEEFLIWGVAVKALSKSESDVTLAIRERDQSGEALFEWATMREFNKPRRRVIGGSPGDPLDDNQYDPADWRWR